MKALFFTNKNRLTFLLLDLFQKVVTISGSIFCGWGFSREWVVEETKTVADAVGCGDRDIFYNSDALKKCLRAIPVEKIWQAVYFSVIKVDFLDQMD